jgi:hypothetical protein
MKAMDDYRLCVVCRGVTYESIRVPGGYKHFSDWRQLIEHDDPDKQCRLCEMIYEALAGRLLLEHAEFEKHMKAKAVSCSIRIFLPEPDIVHLYKTQSAIRSKESIYYPMTIRCGPCVIWAPALCKWKDYPETIEASLLLLPKYNSKSF